MDYTSEKTAKPQKKSPFNAIKVTVKLKNTDFCKSMNNISHAKQVQLLLT